jgi:hypothetical protein
MPQFPEAMMTINARGPDQGTQRSEVGSMRAHRAAWYVPATVCLALVLASCAADQPGPVPLVDAPGFWKGLWHGFIAPVTFFVSVFSDHVRIYAFPNAGRWYDFGFMLGISGFSGGVFAGSRRKPEP